MLGFTDRECRLCFGLALWNGRDPILKERLFGLTGPEGNHGEDATPRRSINIPKENSLISALSRKTGIAAFSGVRVLTYTLMSNHFHLLCEVPPAQKLSEAQLLERIQAGYGPARRQALDQELAHLWDPLFSQTA